MFVPVVGTNQQPLMSGGTLLILSAVVFPLAVRMVIGLGKRIPRSKSNIYYRSSECRLTCSTNPTPSIKTS